MKEDELRKHTVCSLCGRKLGQTESPFFYTLKVNRYGLDIGAIRRNAGLVEMMGGITALARALSPDEDMAEEVMDEVTVTLCDDCACDRVVIASLIETAVKEADG
jgi:hypothetical protein